MKQKKEDVKIEDDEIIKLNELLEEETKKTDLLNKKLDIKKRIMQEKQKQLSHNPFMKLYKEFMKLVFNFD